MDRYPTLTRILRERLSQKDLEALKGEARPVSEEDYDRIIARAAQKARQMSEHVDYSKGVISERLGDLLSLPPGRRQTLLANCSPTFLAVLTHELMTQSWEARFTDPERSLALAELANETSDLLSETEFPSLELSSDLCAEARAHLANARRLRADLDGAAQALSQAEESMAHGTGDRSLRSDLLGFRAALLCDTGRGEEAATVLDQEIKLRRLLGDQAKLALTLIGRGRISCWIEPLDQACRFMHEGAQLAEDPRMQLVALFALARRLARDGDGEYAWRTLSSAVLPLAVVDEPRFRTEDRWIRGLALRALGRLDDAERELKAVCEILSQGGPSTSWAFACVDLACVLIARGDLASAKKRANDAWGLLVDQRAALPMLSALLVLGDAIRQETATEAFAIDVANFLGRYQLDHRLRLRVRRR